jgi:hypothetical protein
MGRRGESLGWFWTSGVGLLVLTGGVVISVVGVIWDDEALRLTGLISIVIGVVATIYDAKTRNSWPWNRRRF